MKRKKVSKVFPFLLMFLGVGSVALSLKWRTFLGNWVFLPFFPNWLDLTLLFISGLVLMGYACYYHLEIYFKKPKAEVG